MADLMRPPEDAPRFLHQWYAALGRYFWLPCPLCGNEFGGHEWGRIDGKPDSIPDPDHPGNPNLSAAICPNCTRAGRGIEPQLGGSRG